MKVLLTGATGFLGGRLAALYRDLGHEVAVVVRPQSALARLDVLGSRVQRVEIGTLPEWWSAWRPQIVVHAATSYGRNDEREAEIHAANVDFPLRLLNLALDNSSRMFINVDTTLPAPMNLYAWSKRRFRDSAQAIALGSVCFANVKLESLYGPGDDGSKFPTMVVRKCLANVPRLELTPGEQQRDYLFIDDAVRAFGVLTRSIDDLDSGWHDLPLGTGVAVSIRAFVETVQRHVGSKTELAFGALPYRSGEIMESRADWSTLRALGWSPTVDVTEGIRRLVDHERLLCAY
jgi:nucleoside-diphosphate-sugar epimerase